jgi:hypothetical protein
LTSTFADIAVIVVALGFVGGVAAARVALRRAAARFRPDGALADAVPDAEGRFALELPAGGPIDVLVQYTVHASRRSGGGLAYGAAMRLDVRRDGDGDGAWAFQAEYLLGQAHRPFGEVPVAEALAAGPQRRAGRSISRGLLLTRVPAGGPLLVRGRVEATRATEDCSILVFARPPR